MLYKLAKLTFRSRYALTPDRYRRNGTVDEMGVDEMGVDGVGSRRSGMIP